MWLITTFLAAIIATLASVIFKKKYRLGFLSLMLWGGTVMIFTDRLLGYNGGDFLEIKTGGLIQNGALLGLVMLLPIIAIWLAANLLKSQNLKNK